MNWLWNLPYFWVNWFCEIWCNICLIGVNFLGFLFYFIFCETKFRLLIRWRRKLIFWHFSSSLSAPKANLYLCCKIFLLFRVAGDDEGCRRRERRRDGVEKMMQCHQQPIVICLIASYFTHHGYQYHSSRQQKNFSYFGVLINRSGNRMMNRCKCHLKILEYIVIENSVQINYNRPDEQSYY